MIEVHRANLQILNDEMDVIKKFLIFGVSSNLHRYLALGAIDPYCSCMSCLAEVHPSLW